ncbi:NAD(P)/FAD-dependent oxidoreductase [Saccharopolyspora pogona]|uniref:NAD(P)/FAD-dependent oxidoreductase n=1 Tax=Saccharopolyspora pogona TaxID=333966 RepID=UPI001688C5BB|nr:FAD-dependent oxidoreductase [Saccharopolyspora pogona]
MTLTGDVLVVGASVASGAFVAQLREDGFEGRVLVVDQDPDAPYDRPPLSKEFLADSAESPGAPWWHDGCELVRGRATALDVASSTVRVEFEDGSESALAAEQIVIATGSVPVRLPGEPAGVAQLRTAADARRIRDSVAAERRIVILGAGTIGTELASSLTLAGAQVSLVDLTDNPLDRFLCGHLGAEAAAWIRDAGVSLHLGSRVEGVLKQSGGWRVVTDSAELSADLVVSAVGTRPATAWLAGSGLDVADGVRCDDEGTVLDTSGSPVSGVRAIGDVSAWGLIGAGARRCEDWTNAQRQGRSVARALLGKNPVHMDAEPAYFWSHQFGRKIQVLGHPDREATLVQHVDEPHRKAAFYTLERGAETVAWIAINTPREFAMAMRKSIQALG